MLIGSSRRTALRLIVSAALIAASAIAERFIPMPRNEQNTLAVFADLGKAITGEDRTEAVYEVLSVVEFPKTTTNAVESGQSDNTIRISYAE